MKKRSLLLRKGEHWFSSLIVRKCCSLCLGDRLNFLLVLIEAIHLCSGSPTSAPSDRIFCQLVKAAVMEIFIQRTFQIQNSSPMLTSDISAAEAMQLAETMCLPTTSSHDTLPAPVTTVLSIKAASQGEMDCPYIPFLLCGGKITDY